MFNIDMLINREGAAKKFLQPFLDGLVRFENLPILQSRSLKSDLEKLFETMKSKNEFFELKTYSLLYGIFAELYQNGYIIKTENTIYRNQDKVVFDLIDWIENHLCEPITLDILSEKTGLNKKYLCRIFKAYTSKTIVNYINELRIEKAAYEMSVWAQMLPLPPTTTGLTI